MAAAIDLTDVAAGTGGFVIFGQSAGNKAGTSVASAGDINGDGFSDLIIGAPGGGAAYVLFGRASGFPASVSLADVAAGSGGFAIVGLAADLVGTSVASAGDINGDGFADLIIGAPGGGDSYVLLGHAGSFAASVSLADVAAGTGGFAITGLAADKSGASVASAGDINGDGFDDLIIGSPRTADPLNGAQNGAAYVVYGKADGYGAGVDLTSIATGTGGFAIYGRADNAGTSVASAGDINGDGFDDLLIGAPGASDPVIGAGETFLVYGKASGFGAGIQLADVAAGSGGFVLSGQDPFDQSGGAVASAGDYNGDGFADLLIGASLADFPFSDVPPFSPQPDAGEGYLIFGKAGSFGTSVTVSSIAGTAAGGVTNFNRRAGDKLGQSLASAGDVNGDGYDDYIISAPFGDTALTKRGDAGESYVLFGTPNGGSYHGVEGVRNGAGGGFAIYGQNATDQSGFSVASAGDINGDGFADLIIGANMGDGAGNTSANAGDTYIIFGRDFDGTVTLAGTTATDFLLGSAAVDDIVGGLGNDTLFGGGGADVLIGGAGDDVIRVSDLTFLRVDGGSGTDTLALHGAGMSLNLSTIPDSKLQGIERIDLTGSGNNVMLVSALEVVNLSATSNSLTVDGNIGDRATFTDLGWIGGATTDGYRSFTNGQATVRVNLSLLDALDATTISITANARFAPEGNAGTTPLTFTLTRTGSLAGVSSIAWAVTGAADVADFIGGVLPSGTATFAAGVATATITVNVAGDVVGELDEAFTVTLSAPVGALIGNASATTTIVNDDAPPLTLIGGVYDDYLTGYDGADSLGGRGGNDTLDGGAAADTMVGGPGDDLYFVENRSDLVLENPDEGNDTVRTTLSYYTLRQDVEALIYTGASDFAGTGNVGNNRITGGAGADTLNGSWGGADTLVGLGGNDSYDVDSADDVVVEAAGGGNDTVYTNASSYTLGDNIEELMKWGSDPFYGTGNALNNRMMGWTSNDTLDGGSGADTLIGLWGSDVYIIDDIADYAVEGPNEGIDTVRTSLLNYTLGPDIENLEYTGAGNFTGFGSLFNNVNNLMTGGAGDDFLLGLDGNDTMIGGLGDDRYRVADAGDVVVEAGGAGNDTVYSALAVYTLAANVEALLFDSVGNFTGRGNGLDNAITGGASNDLLDGYAGADTLIGATGDDTLVGGLGNDVYIVDSLDDFAAENPGEGIDTVRTALANYTLQANLENAQRIGGGDFILFGNGLDNQLTGDVGDDFLLGQGGLDTMAGGNGNDRYMVDEVGDLVVEGVGEGSDTVYTSLSHYDLPANVEWVVYAGAGNFSSAGNALGNVMFGGAGADSLNGAGGNDTLNGLAGADSLTGGAGLDSFIVTGSQLATPGFAIDAGADWDSLVLAGDISGGADASFASLSGLEVMLFTGTGAQSVTLGNNAGTAFGGAIFTYAPVATSLSIDAGTMTTGMLTAFGTGNADTIIGGALADIIIGLGGGDSLSGMGGNDSFTLTATQLAAPGLRINGGTGFDTLLISGDLVGTTDAQFTDVANLDELRITGFGAQSMAFGSAAGAAFNGLVSVQSPNASSVNIDGSLLGTAALYAWGTAGADTISGAAGADRFVSNGGADMFSGGAGGDTFVFSPGELAAAAQVAGGADLDFLMLKGNSLTLTDATFATTSGMEWLMLLGSGTHTLTLGANAAAAFGSALTVKQDTFSVLHLDASGVGVGTSVSASSYSGADTMIGGAGNDYFTGASGADLFGVGLGQDVISDFVPGLDHITLQAGSFANFTALFAASSQVGLSTKINLGGGNMLTLTNVDRTFLSGADFGLP